MWNYLIFSGLFAIVSLLLTQNLKRPISIVDRGKTRYDYVIVGAGTAGCVMASRLSANSNTTVLLVEAGGYFGWLSTIPIAAPILQKSYMDWAYKTESQSFSSKGLLDNRQNIPRGKGLGGSGQLNYLVHSFGRPEDYSHWPEGWSHVELQPYFHRVTKLVRARAALVKEDLARAMREAANSLWGSGASFAEAQTTLYKGARWSTYHSHLRAAWDRANLHILVDTTVTRVSDLLSLRAIACPPHLRKTTVEYTTLTPFASLELKILLDKENKIVGVEVQYEDGLSEEIEATEEVILCAGAIGTPHLLMISGIGPRDQLDKFKIPVQLDVPAVGKNYIDHFNMPVYVQLKSPVSITLKKLQSISTIVQYFLFGTGLLASNGIMGIARVNDSAVLLAGIASTDEKLLKIISNYRTKTFRSLFPSYADPMRHGFIFMSNCLQPKSRGNITLGSNSIFDRPIIEPAFLERYEDVACTINAIRLGLSIIRTPLFRKFGAEVHVPDIEECQDLVQDYRDDAFAECVIRVAGLTSHHPTGTCKMGNSDEDGVVDEFLRVHGIQGLRIVDASVLPIPVSGMPNSVIIVLAERLAGIILQSSKFKR
ncbi:PREDICTED: neither inactivation nor afterpotential protein G [Ceratosolen solmsi marchali]|uniref:Neither inactivation nor afterpotential protein G n=1 Tax=Ceratosolen solmsi marchali TaxID=326594 RepID=A0AAJ7DXW3_9HYME|nr:PREDICTED: neither inactivation nor afterpotential protein G [Ceratosolen solmsi marchali]